MTHWEASWCNIWQCFTSEAVTQEFTAMENKDSSGNPTYNNQVRQMLAHKSSRLPNSYLGSAVFKMPRPVQNSGGPFFSGWAYNFELFISGNSHEKQMSMFIGTLIHTSCLHNIQWQIQFPAITKPLQYSKLSISWLGRDPSYPSTSWCIFRVLCIFCKACGHEDWRIPLWNLCQTAMGFWWLPSNSWSYPHDLL